MPGPAPYKMAATAEETAGWGLGAGRGEHPSGRSRGYRGRGRGGERGGSTMGEQMWDSDSDETVVEGSVAESDVEEEEFHRRRW